MLFNVKANEIPHRGERVPREKKSLLAVRKFSIAFSSAFVLYAFYKTRSVVFITHLREIA